MGEPPATALKWAGKSFLRPLVDSHVDREIVPRAEGSATNAAHKSFLSLVRPGVGLQVTFSWENLGAANTTKQRPRLCCSRFFLGIHHAARMRIDLVRCPATLRGKALAARLADERLEVGSHMFLETFGRDEPLAERTGAVLLRLAVFARFDRHPLLRQEH